MLSDKEIMSEVLKLAEYASKSSEVPIACIIVQNDKIIAKKHNLKETSKISAAHAEILAIKEASEKLGKWRLNDCKIYVNLEPCLMCLGAILEARFSELIFSLYDYNMGGINGRYGIGEKKLKLTQLSLKTGILAEESKNIIHGFFKGQRTENKFNKK